MTEVLLSALDGIWLKESLLPFREETQRVKFGTAFLFIFIFIFMLHGKTAGRLLPRVVNVVAILKNLVCVICVLSK